MPEEKTSRLGIGQVILAVILLVLAASAYVVLTENKTFLSQTAAPIVAIDGSISESESLKLGLISLPENILEVKLSYNADATPPFLFVDMVRKSGHFPEPVTVFNEDTFVLELKDASNKKLLSYPFIVPIDTSGSPEVLEDVPSRSDDTLRSHMLFTLTLPWVAQARTISLTTLEGEEIASTTLKNVQFIKRQSSFRSIPGEEILRKLKGVKDQDVESNPKVNLATPVEFLKELLSPTVSAQKNNNSLLDVTFVGHGYTTEQLPIFHNDVVRLSTNLLKYEPFASRASQIVFHYVDNTKDLRCLYAGATGRLIVCSGSDAIAALNSAGVPYDRPIVVIVNNPARGASSAGAGSPVFVYNGSDAPDVFVHEFGHSLGGLNDEYLVFSTDGVIDNKVHQNCYAGTPPALEWQNKVALSDYNLGCMYPNWYRSSANSVMKSTSARYFNTVSQEILNKAIDKIVGPVSVPDTSAPQVSIANPIKNAAVSGVTQVSISATDDKGVTQVELWKNGTLYQTLYSAPYNFSWSTTGDINGTYNLQAFAYDAAKNKGSSTVVNVTVNNASPDTTLPKVSINSPGKNATVKGVVTVSAVASDDSKTVSKVEFYKDNVLVGTDSTTPFSFLWDTTVDVNGSHTLQAFAIDPSKNRAGSTSVIVNVLNEVDVKLPKVSLTKPFNRSSLSATKDLAIKARGSDNVGVSKIELFMDGTLILECLKTTTCNATVASTTITSGVHLVKAVVYDAAGNSISKQNSFTKK